MRLRAALYTAAFTAVALLAGCKPDVGPRDEVAVLDTNYGRIIFEFLPDDAPRHVANFKKLTRQGFYDGTKFHKVVKEPTGKLLAIQGGDPNTINGSPATWGYGQPGQKTVPAEFSKTLRTGRGIVAASRKQDDPNSATSQFFICLGPDPDYDGKYSIFGKVIDGMNVVESIARAPLIKNTTRPVDPVVITRAYLAKRDEVMGEARGR